MFSKNNSYFDPELRRDGHYIITGYTNDNFCSDALQLTNINMELHRHLRYEQGFDAVIFFDAINKLYCYDRQSLGILDGHLPNRESTATAGTVAAEREEVLVQSGPIGRRRVRQNNTTQPAPNRRSAGTELHHAGYSMEYSWQQLISLLRDTEVKCAIVFSNMNSLQYTLNTEALQVLEELSTYRDSDFCVAVYIFRETSSIENILESSRQGTPQWDTLVQTVLRPRMETDDVFANRVIFLRTPNRCEIRNLLVYLSAREHNRISIRKTEINELATLMAAASARERLSLKEILLRIERYAERNPLETLAVANWTMYLGCEGYRTALEQLDSMVGISAMQAKIHSWHALRIQLMGGEVTEQVQSSRFTPPPAAEQTLGHALNVCLKGGPGTGKTTIARLMGQMYYELGLLPQGQLIECAASDLVSQNVGGTAPLVSQRVQEAMGGVLLIDEAYALTTDAHGLEAINQLVYEMSAYEGQFAVVLAGYPDRMEDFMRQNEGLSRRISETYVLEDYSPQDLKAIFRQMVEKDSVDIQIDEGLEERMDDFFEAWVSGKTSSWGNAGEAQKLLVAMKRNCSARMVAEGQSDGMEGCGLIFTTEDIPEELGHCLKPASKDLDEALKQIDEMIGLHNIKKFLRQLVVDIKWGINGRAPGNYIFAGPPGTGKTMVARKMGEILGHLHVLRRKINNVVVCNAGDLLNGVITVREAVNNARGGVLFIDEAHQLEQNERKGGHDIIRELVPLIEDPEIRMDTCFICAGYVAEMNKFLAVDSGLERRFPHNNRIRFNNYTAKELVAILKGMALERGEIPSDGYLTRSYAALIPFMENPHKRFGNAGYIRDTFLPESISARNARLNMAETGSKDGIVTTEQVEKYSDVDRRTLTAEDIPPRFLEKAGPVGMKSRTERNLEVLLSELIGKQEIVEYIRSKMNKDKEYTFFDSATGCGMHYAISGPLGSGKHTVIRTIATAFQEYGLLESAEVNFQSKGRLEAGFVGQTAEKTQEVVEHALGGTLVVEYPSALLPKSGTDNTFGPEALGVIVGAMREHSDDLCVVFMDTPEGMEEVLKAFPALRGNLSKEFLLEDLSPSDMEKLFELKTGDSLMMEEEQVAPLMSDFFLNWVSNRGGLGEAVNSWGNGLEVDKLMDQLKQNWLGQGGKVQRITYEEGECAYHLDKRVITADMFPEKIRRYLTKTSLEAEEALKELMDMTGLRSVKDSILKIRRRIRYAPGDKVYPGYYCYLGNPGTGKTTVAKLMGGILRAAGALSQGHVIVRTAREMGDSFEEFDKILKLAKNGILFIDEAHQLAERTNPRGYEVIKRLLTVLEDDEVISNTCIILAGYPVDMVELFKRDSGLKSRFGTDDSIIYFEDYTPEELLEILEEMAAKANKIGKINASGPLRLSQEYRDASLEIFEMMCDGNDPEFGNARFVRNYLHDSLDGLYERMDELYGDKDDPPSDEMDYLIRDDIPVKYMQFLRRKENIFVANTKQLDMQEKGCIVDDAPSRLYDEMEISIVHLRAEKNGAAIGEGTGSIITWDGHILTCNHVIEEADKVFARLHCPGLPGGEYKEYECTILSPSFKDCDMAVLKLPKGEYKPLPVRPSKVPIGLEERTLIMGYPLGKRIAGGRLENLRCSKFFGRVASKQVVANMERCYIDSSGMHGNSGSPVISREDGRIIGVFTGAVSAGEEDGAEMFNFFFPITYFWERFMQVD